MCVCVSLVIGHVMRMRHIVICGLSHSTVFFHIISYKRNDLKKKVVEHKKFVLISSAAFFFVCTFLILKELSDTF